MKVANLSEPCLTSALCAQCGIPLDAKYFDESGVKKPPELGGTVVLARFELSPQHCGVLEYFSQFTDAYAKDPRRIKTPGLAWMILANSRPLYPYLPLKQIVNPWGYGSFPVSIRLDDSAAIEFIVRGVTIDLKDRIEVEEVEDPERPEVKKVGGRIVGRYWYNPAYGDVVRGAP